MVRPLYAVSVTLRRRKQSGVVLATRGVYLLPPLWVAATDGRTTEPGEPAKQNQQNDDVTKQTNENKTMKGYLYLRTSGDNRERQSRIAGTANALYNVARSCRLRNCCGICRRGYRETAYALPSTGQDADCSVCG